MLPLSSRSVRTGVGSRGGHGHTYRDRGPAYWREWRAAHPEYRERDNLRRHEAKRKQQLIRDRVEVDALIASLDSV